MWSRIEGWILVPHELLHVAAYRLIGKPCRYQLGDVMVQGSEPKTWREQLLVLLFPLTVMLALLLLTTASWFGWYLHSEYSANPLVYFRTAPMWHQLLWWFSLGLACYASTCALDVRAALQLLIQQLTQHPPNNSYKGQYKRERPEHSN